MLNPVDFSAGSLIHQRYRVVRRLGFGSFGSAFKVADTMKEDASMVCKVLRVTDDPADMFEKEVIALKQCIGLSRWPQISDSFTTKSFKTIVLTLEGEAISDVISRNSPSRFSLPNVLRITYGVFDALQTLHRVGYLHRDVTQNNLMLKTVDERIVVKMIDLGNSAKVDPPPQCWYSFFNTSLHVMKTRVYTQYDDLISALYLLIEISGTEPFDAKLPLLEAKEQLHSDPSTWLDKSRWFLGTIITLIDEMKAEKSSKMKRIWNHLENSISKVSPYSPIEFKILEGRVMVD